MKNIHPWVTCWEIAASRARCTHCWSILLAQQKKSPSLKGLLANKLWILFWRIFLEKSFKIILSHYGPCASYSDRAWLLRMGNSPDNLASPLVSPKHTLLLSTQMLELGEDRQHFGSPCLHKLLRRKGLARKHKRAERIWPGRKKFVAYIQTRGASKLYPHLSNGWWIL